MTNILKKIIVCALTLTVITEVPAVAGADSGIKRHLKKKEKKPRPIYE